MITVKLFSYGTLQDESVQLSSFGRKLHGSPDILTGYRLENLIITDPHVLNISGQSVHKILIATGNVQDEIAGTVFDITDQELQAADRYEVDDYERISVILKSGTQAWVYVARNQTQ